MKKNRVFLGGFGNISYLCQRIIDNWRNMCTLSIKLDDKILNRVKPHFNGDGALNDWIESVLHSALEEYAEQFESQGEKADNRDDFLKMISELKDDPEGFFKLGGILGKPRTDFSWKELRDEAIFDKYGL